MDLDLKEGPALLRRDRGGVLGFLEEPQQAIPVTLSALPSQSISFSIHVTLVSTLKHFVGIMPL